MFTFAETPVGRLVERLRRRRQPAESHGDGAPAPAELAAWSKAGHNPLVVQRHEFHNRFYDLVKAKRNWQIVAFMALAILGVVTVAYVRMASTSRITPYVVEVSELGVARAFGPADEITVDDRIVIAELAEFIRNIRRVVADPYAQRELILEGYAFVDRNAQQFLDAYFSRPENDPRLLGRTVRREIHLESILRVPNSESWRVRWVERERKLQGGTTTRAAWEAILAVKVVPPATTANLDTNPLGVYITDINWGPINTIGGEEDEY